MYLIEILNLLKPIDVLIPCYYFHLLFSKIIFDFVETYYEANRQRRL